MSTGPAPPLAGHLHPTPACPNPGLVGNAVPTPGSFRSFLTLPPLLLAPQGFSPQVPSLARRPLPDPAVHRHVPL